MKAFYSPVVRVVSSPASGVISIADRETPVVRHICLRARIAVYRDMTCEPCVYEVESQPVDEFTESLSAKIHELSSCEGGTFPCGVLREVTENFIHADFSEVVVSVLDGGSTIRFADRGPGIPDKEKVLLPGFSTAHGEMKKHIRGVGSGLPIVRNYVTSTGGYLTIEDNLGGGSVVTIHDGGSSGHGANASSPSDALIAVARRERTSCTSHPVLDIREEPTMPRPCLSARQQQVLALVLESGLAGPSLVSRELGVGISTAYRDLATLEDAGLIVSESGKRTLTPDGLSFLGELTNRIRR